MPLQEGAMGIFKNCGSTASVGATWQGNSWSFHMLLHLVTHPTCFVQLGGFYTGWVVSFTDTVLTIK